MDWRDEKSGRRSEHNGAGEHRIYERPDQQTSEKHEAWNCKADATA